MCFLIIFIYVNSLSTYIIFFLFQAEDGIRDLYVTGVQTCALPISRAPAPSAVGHQRSARCVVTAQDSGAGVLVGQGWRGARAQADRSVSPGARLPAARERWRGRGARHGRRVVTP